MWELVDRKAVMDYDGFMTEYSMYTNGEKYVMVFGDSDIYGPDEESDWDWETDSAEEAYEWFNDYAGFEEEEE